MNYTDIFSNDPSGLSMGMPTVSPSNMAAVRTPMASGVNPPSPATGAPMVTSQSQGMSQGMGMGNNTGQPGFFSQNGAGQFALGAIQTLGSLWNSFQQNKMARQSFDFQKKAYETNLANQTQSYNTELTDRIQARYATEGRPNAAADAAAYVEKNKL